MAGFVAALSFLSSCASGLPFDDRSASAGFSQEWPRQTQPLDVAHGTTTLAFTFQGGIIAAVDSRATMGSFVGSKTTQKVLPVHSHLLGTMASGAADCAYWIGQLRYEAELYESCNGGRPMSVTRASRILSNLLYELRARVDLSVGTMIMGFDGGDHPEAVPRIFYVDSRGARVEGDVFSVGSGSTYALGILDRASSIRDGMTVEEAVALGVRAIRHATFRDAGSGGFINVYLITREGGWRRVFRQDLCANPKAILDSGGSLRIEQ